MLSLPPPPLCELYTLKAFPLPSNVRHFAEIIIYLNWWQSLLGPRREMWTLSISDGDNSHKHLEVFFISQDI